MESNTFLLALEALSELAPEINSAKASMEPSIPSLEDVLVDASFLPRESLFLGMADDGLPILLNLRDSVPGPLLISADEGAGKTAILQLIARGLLQNHENPNIRFGVITPNPEEWKGFEDSEMCAGIHPVYQRSTSNFIFSLGDWAHTNRSDQFMILLVDDLKRMIETDASVKDTFRWLLLRGPARHVWPIVTLKSSHIQDVQAWLDFFRTRIFGRVRDSSMAEYISGSADSRLESLKPGSRFTMREGADWLQFWIPNPA